MIIFYFKKHYFLDTLLNQLAEEPVMYHFYKKLLAVNLKTFLDISFLPAGQIRMFTSIRYYY